MSLIIATYKGHSGVKFTDNSLEAAISEKKWKCPRKWKCLGNIQGTIVVLKNEHGKFSEILSDV